MNCVYSPTVIVATQQYKKGYTNSVVKKPNNIYHGDEVMHFQYCGLIWPFNKSFQLKTLKYKKEYDTKSAIVNNLSGFLHSALATSIQPHNSRSSICMNHNNNNILHTNKTTMIPVIRTMRPIIKI